LRLFRAEKVAEFQSPSGRRCWFCGQKLELVRTFVDVRTGDTIHIFECECGERVWDD
jgi:hypothetical protein